MIILTKWRKSKQKIMKKILNSKNQFNKINQKVINNTLRITKLNKI